MHARSLMGRWYGRQNYMAQQRRMLRQRNIKILVSRLGIPACYFAVDIPTNLSKTKFFPTQRTKQNNGQLHEL